MSKTKVLQIKSSKKRHYCSLCAKIIEEQSSYFNFYDYVLKEGRKFHSECLGNFIKKNLKKGAEMIYESFQKRLDLLARAERPNKPGATRNSSPKELRCVADKLEQYYIDKEKHDEELKELGEQRKEILNQFKHALIDEYGLTGLSNVDDVYDYAWQGGHAEGLHGVEGTFSELSELFFPHLTKSVCTDT